MTPKVAGSSPAAPASRIRWARVSNADVEHAIQQGPHGDEFVKLLDGTCLCREPLKSEQKLIDALRAARRVIASERKWQWECFTIAPDRSFDHMNDAEKRAIRRFDRALAKIDEALS